MAPSQNNTQDYDKALAKFVLKVQPYVSKLSRQLLATSEIFLVRWPWSWSNSPGPMAMVTVTDFLFG
jgi:hypothetical protein